MAWNKKMPAYPVVAVAGATGAVGREMLKCLEALNFPASEVRALASARSAGEKLPFAGCGKVPAGELTVQEMTEESFQGVDIALFSAGASVSKKFRKAVVDAGAELVLVVRGGGSFEDLMPFNDERLARTIAACPVPVVTGIGHEPDTTIADLVADLRCSTPTAAAEAVSPEDGYLDNVLTQSAVKMKSCVERKLHLEALRLDGQVRRSLFRDSQALLSQEWMGLDYSAERLSRAIPMNIMRDKSSLDAAQASLRKLSTTLVAADKQRVADISQRASKAVAANLDRFDAQLSLAAAQVNSLSPLAVLGRGYSIVFNGEGGVVHNANAVHVGDDVRIRLGQGSLSCKVNAVNVENHALEKEKQ